MHSGFVAEALSRILREPVKVVGDSLADLFRQIGYDERVHKLESLERVEEARFQ